MARQIDIKSTYAINSFVPQLKKEAHDYEEVIRRADLEAQKARGLIQERTRHWERRARALESMLANCYRVPFANCSPIEKELQAALGNLAECRTCMKRLEQAATHFRTTSKSSTAKSQAILSGGVKYLHGVTITVESLINMALARTRVLVKQFPGSARYYSRDRARKQEIELVQRTGSGTRDWTKSELSLLSRGRFPEGYHAHHIRSLSKHPDQAYNPDNILFLTPIEHLQTHRGSWRNPTYGKMLNRRSFMFQRSNSLVAEIKER